VTVANSRLIPVTSVGGDELNKNVGSEKINKNVGGLEKMWG